MKNSIIVSRVFAPTLIILTIIFPVAPAFALGGVDLGTTNAAPTVTTETTTPEAPTATTETTITTTSTDTSAPTTATDTNTTAGDTAVSTNTSTDTSSSNLTDTSITISDTTPPIITDIISASVLPTEATVAWVTDELAVSHFRYGTTTSYGSTVTLGTSGALIHAATMLHLVAGTTYYYCIDATDLFGNSTESCGHSFVTATEVLQADTNTPTISSVNVAPITTTSATLTWTTDQLANGYVEYGRTENYGLTAQTDNAYTPVDTATISNLSPNTTYHYRITAYDEVGNTISTPDETFMTEALAGTGEVIVTAPAPTVVTPSILISGVESSFVGENSVTITWMTDLPSDSQVEFGDSINLGSETITGTTLATSHSVSISNLTPDTNYIFRVKSKPLGATVAIVSNLHEFSTLITPIYVTTPANITSLSSSNVTTTGANIAWTTDISTTGHIEYGITTEYGQAVASLTNQTSHAVSLSHLAPSTTYHFRVKAVNTAGDITYSEDQTFTTPALVNSSQVTNENISAPSTISNLSVAGHDETAVLLSWNAAGADSDTAMLTDVRLSTSPITESNWSSATAAQVTSIIYPELSPNGTHRGYLVAGLLPSTVYYFASKQKYEASEWSEVSNIVTVTTLATLPIGTSLNSSNNEVENTEIGNGNIVSGEITLNTSSSSEAFVPETTTSLPITHPTLINGTGLDRQIVFTWNNPNEADFVRTIIVRKAGNYPTSPTDGTTIYESDSETFTDMNLTNGTTYYYAFYSYDHARSYSTPVRVSLAPAVKASSSRGGSGGSGSKSGGAGSVEQIVFHETPVIIAGGATEHFTSLWKKGDQHLEIEHVQHVLALDGELYPTTKIDGKFRSITEKGLKQFQAKYNLPVTGVTDTATQKKLGLISQSLVTLHVPEDKIVFETNLRKGDKGEAVNGLQEMLTDEGSYVGVIDGKFGRQTQSAVRKFQLKYFIKPPDGIVGPKTRHMLKVLTGL